MTNVTQSPAILSIASSFGQVQSAAGARVRVSTPLLVKAGIVATVLATCLWWVAVSGLIFELKHSAQTIGRDTVPSIVAAQEIRAHLARMNADLADALLAKGSQSDNAWLDLEHERFVLSDKIVSAAQNITFGDAERAPILWIADYVQDYAVLAGRVREAVALDPNHGFNGAANAALRDAVTLMDDTLLPLADKLNDANEQVLNRSWTKSRNIGLGGTILMLACGVPTVAVLVVLQFLLFRRTRRILNPCLALATVIAVLTMLYMASVNSSAARELVNAKENAFDSVNALSKGRAIAYAANADESLYLLDAEWKRHYQDAFRAEMTALAAINIDQPGVADYMKGVLDGFKRAKCPPKSFAFTGLVADELRNVTFAGECEAAVDLFKKLAVYEGIDTRIRALDASGQHEAAIALDIGTEIDQSDWAFEQFGKALAATIAINQREFDKSIGRAFSILSPLEAIISISSVLILVLTFLGVRPRLSEYRE